MRAFMVDMAWSALKWSGMVALAWSGLVLAHGW